MRGEEEEDDDDETRPQTHLGTPARLASGFGLSNGIPALRSRLTPHTLHNTLLALRYTAGRLFFFPFSFPFSLRSFSFYVSNVF